MGYASLQALSRGVNCSVRKSFSSGLPNDVLTKDGVLGIIEAGDFYESIFSYYTTGIKTNDCAAE